MDFETQTDHSIWARLTELILVNKQKRTYHWVDFDIPTEQSEIKECENKKMRNDL